jgi:hypothetical protein
MSRLFLDDVGAQIVVATGNTTIPLTAVLSLIVEKPGLSVVTWSLTDPMIDRTTGIITYTTESGDLDEVGEYRVQVHGVFTDADLYSDIDTFNVMERIS